MAAEGVVAGTLREHDVVALLVERDRPLGPERRERPLAFLLGPRPEQGIGQVDVVDREIGPGNEGLRHGRTLPRRPLTYGART